MSELVDELFGFDADADEVPTTMSKPEITIIPATTVTTSQNDTIDVAAIKHISNVGGGRGVFAQKSLPAGTLIVLEWPILSWEDLDVSSAADMITLITRIINNPDAHKVTQSLHPQRLSDVSVEEVTSAMEGFTDEPGLQGLLALTSKEEVARIYLALRHNGFGSGLYKDLCMVNHSCDPNCIKFEPRAGSRGASEIWSIRAIAEGEEITISYCSPIESLSFPMRSYLNDQHSFHCHCERCKDFESFDYSTTSITADTVEEWDSWIADSEFELQNLRYEVTDIGILEKMADECNRIYSQLKVHQSDIFQPDLLRLQGHNRMLFTSIALKKLSLHEEMSAMSNVGNKNRQQEKHHQQTKQVDSIQLAKIGKDLLLSTVDILRLQRRYLGHDHPDLLTTLTDMSNAIELLAQVISVKDINDFLEVVFWDEVFASSIEPTHLCNIKQLRVVMKEETTRLKNMYAIVKRCPDAVKVIKRPGLSFWGTLSR